MRWDDRVDMLLRKRGRAASLPRNAAKAAEDRHIGFRWLAREARLPGERDAEEVFRGVAGELGECIGANGARHVAAHLPLGLRAIWEEETHRTGKPCSVELDEVIAQLQSRLGLANPTEAEILLTTVCAWLKHLAPEERDDITAILSPRFSELWEKAQLPVVPPWRRLVIPASPTS